MGETLSADQRDIIRQAARSEKYQSAPVSSELRRQFSDNLRSFVFMPYSAQSKLANLYGPGADGVALLNADWVEACACGALRVFEGHTVSFPTHEQLANGEAVEVSISPNRFANGLPWALSYVPDVERLRLMRDCEGAAPAADESAAPAGAPASAASDASVGAAAAVVGTSTGVAPAGTALAGNAAAGNAAAAAPAATPAAAAAAAASLPPVLPDRVEAMKLSDDYQTGGLPTDLLAELRAIDGAFTDFVHVSQRWIEKIVECAKHNLDVFALLDRDWRVALDANALRIYDEKIQFPISILREDGATLVEVTIKRDRKQDLPGSKPWFVSYVNDYAKQKVIAGRALFEWAYLGDVNELLAKLADIALDEKWSFEGEDDRGAYPILRGYLTYTFYRLKAEGKVLEDRDKGIAAFNTGLVDKTYEPIYACFSPSTLNQPWRFEAFCKAGSRLWGKKLVSAVNPLPKRASYFQLKEDLLFDIERSFQRDVDHILLDNIDRLPREFLAEELRTSDEALEALDAAYSSDDPAEKATAFDELREIIEDEAKIKRRLISRLDDAIELAQKRVDWNYKTAVPAFYPTRNTMSLLLPLDLTEDGTPDVALVVELTESGAYIGQTILTMRMAYDDARLICRPDSDWLNTSLKLRDGEGLQRGDGEGEAHGWASQRG